MPWKETSVLDERMKFIGRLLSGEKIGPLCHEFGISRVIPELPFLDFETDFGRAPIQTRTWGGGGSTLRRRGRRKP